MVKSAGMDEMVRAVNSCTGSSGRPSSDSADLANMTKLRFPQICKRCPVVLFQCNC